ncbi:MAG: hypothetical protein ACOY4R_21105 [Pseudomonadota bacterium]
MNPDLEIWLLFAPFWLLGTAALIGGIWHTVHAAIVTRRAQAAGHREPPAQRHYHLRRALLAFGAFFALLLMGLGVGAAVGLLVSG